MRNSRIYRRRCLLRGVGDAVFVDVEDFQHHFALVLQHDGRVVKSIESRAIRTPWAICPNATAILDVFVGLPLQSSPFAMLALVDPRQQCTHLADMASLAASAAARFVVSRLYDIVIAMSAPEEVAAQDFQISRNGRPLFAWRLVNHVIQQPDPLAGLEPRRAATWPPGSMETADTLEALFVAQRTFMVSNGVRQGALELVRHAEQSAIKRNACYSMQEIRIARASRNLDSVRRFSTQDELLADIIRS